MGSLAGKDKLTASTNEKVSDNSNSIAKTGHDSRFTEPLANNKKDRCSGTSSFNYRHFLLLRFYPEQLVSELYYP
jgi:hypothetical protein